jgi:hypothetical protein
MGITIHYSGRARSADALSEILKTAQMFAAGRGWHFAIYEDPFGVMDDRDKDDPGWLEHGGPYRGIVIRPHRLCESVRLDFTIVHELRPAFTKTQFAPFGVHKGVVALLRAVEPHMERFEVMDESGLWETGDEAAARSRFEALGRVLDGLADALRAEGAEGPDARIDADAAYDLDDVDPREEPEL